MRLSDLKNGESAIIIKVSGHGGFRKRIMEMGFVRGQKVTSVLDSPMNDPVKYSVMGYEVSLRRSEAQMIETLPENEAEMVVNQDVKTLYLTDESEESSRPSKRLKSENVTRKNEIQVALVGNPNSGKTSLFNALSGGNEHVGNYSGVTVDAKSGHFNYKGYHIDITDLPGTYSLSAYTPEEVYVRKHIYEKMPDIIINSVVASNLKRNLYLTTELIDLNQRTVVALNMYDELSASGAQLDYEHLGAMMGIPMVPTVAKSGKGLDKLLDTVIDLFEGRNTVARHVHINYGTVLEDRVVSLAKEIHEADDIPQEFPARYWSLKLIENDGDIVNMIGQCRKYGEWKKVADKSAAEVEKELHKDAETAISDAKYGFIDGALQETFVEGDKDINKKTRFIDRLVVNKWLGFPIFFLILWLMFTATFKLGAYPQEWIEMGFDALGAFFSRIMPENAFKDLVVNGIIGGVGSVAVFLPNILILYLFISFMEDSGYMARAAFIMDKLMHKMGLHGKSFIPLIMGFGCNVPAIMATRTIESRSSRLITILITPFMSCSARLPVYILLIGTFFPKNAALILIGFYLLGAIVAIITARLLRKSLFKVDETPFVMELPPYRWPTLRATLKHMWDKCAQYLKKIGTVILVATVIIWFLSYYPRYKFPEAQCEHSYIGQVGKFIEPVMHPIGLDWRASVAIISSIPAKELVISTLGVLYKDSGNDNANLSESLKNSGEFTQASAMSFMVFILLFFPCIATLAAIYNETGKKRWVLFTSVYNTAVAWIVAYLAFLIF